MRDNNMRVKIKLSSFGERVKLGLAPQTKKLIGKEMSLNDYEKELLKIGTASRSYFKLENKKGERVWD